VLTRQNIYDMVQSETGTTNRPKKTINNFIYQKGVLIMNNNFDLTGKVAVVTGASTEIGAEAAMAYAQAGADVALLGDNTVKLNEVKAEIEKMGRRVVAVTCDVTNEANVKLAVKTVLNTFGKIDILLNNSNIALQDGLEDMSDADWNRLFGGILRGVYFTSKHVIPQMKKNGYGKIINVSSANSRASDKYGRWEVSPKEMVANLTKDLANMYSQFGITVNTIGPEKINKGAFADTVMYLSSDESKVILGKLVDESCVAAIA